MPLGNQTISDPWQDVKPKPGHVEDNKNGHKVRIHNDKAACQVSLVTAFSMKSHRISMKTPTWLWNRRVRAMEPPRKRSRWTMSSKRVVKKLLHLNSSCSECWDKDHLEKSVRKAGLALNYKQTLFQVFLVRKTMGNDAGTLYAMKVLRKATLKGQSV